MASSISSSNQVPVNVLSVDLKAALAQGKLGNLKSATTTGPKLDTRALLRLSSKMREPSPVLVQSQNDSPAPLIPDTSSATVDAYIAAHRYGFGMGPRDLAAIRSAGGARPWLRAQFEGAPDFGQNYNTHGDNIRLYYTALWNGSFPERERLMRELLNNVYMGQAVRYFREAVNTTKPALFSWNMFLMNNFSISFRTDREEDLLIGGQFGAYFKTILDNSRGKMKDLLYAITLSPAMMEFLNTQINSAGAVNQNYAREILELHTMGVNGGYTQEDINALARLFAGFRYIARLSSGYDHAGEVTVSGGNVDLNEIYIPVLNLRLPAIGAAWQAYDRMRRVLDAIAIHPSTADHFCTAMVRYFFMDDMNLPMAVQMKNDLKTVYLNTQGDLKQVALAMFNHPNALTRLVRSPMKRPDEIMMAFLRVSGLIAPAAGAAGDLGDNFIRDIVRYDLPAMNCPFWQAADVQGFPVTTDFWLGRSPENMLSIIDRIGGKIALIMGQRSAADLFHQSIGPIARTSRMTLTKNLMNNLTSNPTLAVMGTFCSAEFMTKGIA